MGLEIQISKSFRADLGNQRHVCSLFSKVLLAWFSPGMLADVIKEQGF